MEPSEIWRVLLDRRWGEKHVGYAESHDQALVGDKTLAFRLMDAAMYGHMGRNDPHAVVERGVALHKIIRLLTFSLAGEGYLNFMGNEFGHPEWVDFPREGNNFSFLHARRQWSLADNPDLRYAGLQSFDAAFQHLDRSFHLLSDPLIEQLALHEDTHQIVYRRGPARFRRQPGPVTVGRRASHPRSGCGRLPRCAEHGRRSLCGFGARRGGGFRLSAPARRHVRPRAERSFVSAQPQRAGARAGWRGEESGVIRAVLFDLDDTLCDDLARRKRKSGRSPPAPANTCPVCPWTHSPMRTIGWRTKCGRRLILSTRHA
jgi:hypothetical protein